MLKLAQDGWALEEPLDIAVVSRPGKVDAVLYAQEGPVALEWETGNISSSHRALNKMALGLLKASQYTDQHGNGRAERSWVVA